MDTSSGSRATQSFCFAAGSGSAGCATMRRTMSSLVGEIRGSPIRSHGGRKLASCSPVNPMRDSAASTNAPPLTRDVKLGKRPGCLHHIKELPQFSGLLGLSISRPVAGQQESGGLPSFDVATVKPSSHPLTPEGYSFSDQKVVSPGRFRAVNSNLDELVRWAYDVEEYQISEPDWLKSNSVTFDIEAVAGSDATAMQIRLMLRRLLRERFRY